MPAERPVRRCRSCGALHEAEVHVVVAVVLAPGAEAAYTREKTTQLAAAARCPSCGRRDRVALTNVAWGGLAMGILGSPIAGIVGMFVGLIAHLPLWAGAALAIALTAAAMVGRAVYNLCEKADRFAHIGAPVESVDGRAVIEPQLPLAPEFRAAIAMAAGVCAAFAATMGQELTSILAGSLVAVTLVVLLHPGNVLARVIAAAAAPVFTATFLLVNAWYFGDRTRMLRIEMAIPLGTALIVSGAIYAMSIPIWHRRPFDGVGPPPS